MIAFRVGAQDAPEISRQLGDVLPIDLVRLPNYHAYVQLMIDGEKSRPFSMRTWPPPISTSVCWSMSSTGMLPSFGMMCDDKGDIQRPAAPSFFNSACLALKQPSMASLSVRRFTVRLDFARS